MFDYESHFRRYCMAQKLELTLSFDMPAGYETAYGTFDVAPKTVFINEKALKDAPDCEKAFYLFHELRHAAQYLRPETFGDEIARSLHYVIMYDGTCYKTVNGAYRACKLCGGEARFTDLYLGQPYEADANTYAYEQVKKLYGETEELRSLYAFWTPSRPIASALFQSVYDEIDEKTRQPG